jgi:hypothetical protein
MSTRLPVLCFPILLACQPLAGFPDPEGFQRIDDDGFAYRAVTAEDSALTCRIQDREEADLDYFARLVERHLDENLGYDDLARTEAKWGDVSGHKFAATVVMGGLNMAYAAWFFVEGHDAYAWQYAGKAEVAEADIQAIEASLADSAP